jgi:hypothetical protein
MAAYICNFTVAIQMATLSTDQWMPKLDRLGPTRYTQLSLINESFSLDIASKLLLIMSHSCFTITISDTFYSGTLYEEV